MSAAAAPLSPLLCATLGTIPYQRAWALQRDLARARSAGRLRTDALLLLEHPPVYTMGRNGEPGHLRAGAASLTGRGAEYHEVDRGGSVTFHGPGQLVAYPIVRLAEAFPIPNHPSHGDVLRYLRALEDALITTCRRLGVAAGRRPPYTGAWVGNAKVAAIGVKLAGGVTTHGIGLNVSTDLRWFDAIVPCGISDGTVTTMRAQGCGAGVEEVGREFSAALAATLGRQRVDVSEAELRRQVADPIAAP